LTSLQDKQSFPVLVQTQPELREGIRMHIGDNRIWTLLEFLFTPEDSTKMFGDLNGRQVVVDKAAAAIHFREIFKSVVWIILSICFAMTLAHLN